jgi:hypothetical protein
MIDAHSQSNSHGLESFLQRLWTTAYAAFRKGNDWLNDRIYARDQAGLLDELEKTGDLEVLMEITGATREQLRATELSPLAALDLLHRMMERLGINPQEAATQADAMIKAQWRCRLCTEWRECRHWLDTDASDVCFRDFCANADLLERLRARLDERAAARRLA